MDFKELQKKIDHARSLKDNNLPSLRAQDFVQLIDSRRDSDQPYLTYINEDDETVHLTYSEFCEKVYGVARFLQGRGLRQGDRIATISHNHWHTVVQYFAAWLLGLVVVPREPGRG